MLALIAALLQTVEAAPPPRLALSVRVEAELAPEAEALLRAETERLFAPAGLRLEWLPGDRPADVSVTISDRPAERLVAGCRRGLHDHRLGLAALGARRVVLWTDPVARAASGDWDRERPPALSSARLGRALGRTLAHELGHLLLRRNGHPAGGLMRASLTQRDLSAGAGRGPRFSKEEIDELRLRLPAFLAFYR
jgi:hypothetical protein